MNHYLIEDIFSKIYPYCNRKDFINLLSLSKITRKNQWLFFPKYYVNYKNIKATLEEIILNDNLYKLLNNFIKNIIKFKIDEDVNFLKYMPKLRAISTDSVEKVHKLIEKENLNKIKTIKFTQIKWFFRRSPDFSKLKNLKKLIIEGEQMKSMKDILVISDNLEKLVLPENFSGKIEVNNKSLKDIYIENDIKYNNIIDMKKIYRKMI